MKAFIALIALGIAGCASPEEVCAGKLAKLDALRKEVTAEMFRDRMECQALAIEFGGGSDIARDCRADMAAMREIAQQTLADADQTATVQHIGDGFFSRLFIQAVQLRAEPQKFLYRQFLV